MLPKEFNPKFLFDLLRIGRNNDGGYLVEKNSIKNSKTLISFGISNDWSFEASFKSINNVKIFAYDHTLNNYFWSRQPKDLFMLFNNFFKNENGNYFINKKISKVGIKHHESLSLEIPDIFSSLELKGQPPYFLKIDIEGSEYRILDDLVKFSNNIEGIVIEFHQADLHLERIINFIKNINLQLCHVHANNFQNCDKFGVPTTLELTFSKNPSKLNGEFISPHLLDQKNNPNNEEIVIKFKA
jgi:FkbM family methyltransferase